MLYEYLCDNGHKFDRVLKLKDYREPQICDCGAKSRKVLSTPMIAPMFEDYQSPIDGTPITSKRKRLEDLRRNDCVEYDPGMVSDYNNKIAAGEKALEQAVDKTVEQTILAMPGDKREKLGKELSSGLETEYTRGTTGDN